jgi:PAS domain S-box-containing protein
MLSRKFGHSLKESFGRKMIASFIAVIIGVLLVFTLLAAINESGKAKENLREDGELLSSLLSHGSMVGVFAENEQALKQASEGIIDVKDVVSVSIYNAGLKLLYAQDKAPSGKNAPPLLKSGVEGLFTAQAFRISETYRTFEVSRPVVIGPAAKADESLYFGRAGAEKRERVVGYVRIVLSKDSYHKEIVSLLARNTIIMLVFIISSIVIVSFAVKRVTRPLNNLTSSVIALGKGMPVEPVPVETDDEIGGLAGAFNSMVVARGRAEEELRQSEQRFRLIAETIAEVFWMADVELSRMIYVSPAYERVWGRSRESLYEDPRSFFDAVHEGDRERLHTAFEAKKNGYSFKCEYRIVRPDGAVRVIWDSGYPIRDEEGRLTSYIGVAHDITERKRAEEALRSSRETLQKIIDGSSAVIFAKDLDGKYLFINSLYEQLFHVSKNGIIGKTDRDLFPAEAATAFREADLKALQAGATIELEEKVPQDDGLHYYLSTKFPLYDNSGKPYAVCGLATDITERKRAEEKLRLYHEQLLALTLELSRTEARERRSIAIDLHDTVGQALAVAKIKLALLQRAMPSGIIARDVEEVRSQLDQAIQYTRSLTVELSPPTLYDFDLEAALEDLASRIHGQHSLSVTVKKSGCARDELSEELRILLYRTVRELLMNVVKHAAASEASIAVQEDGGQISVIVEDNGKGFEAVNDLHPGRQGGFGLFSIRERLRLLGGRLEIESTPGKGARVVMTAPSRGRERKEAE